MPDKQPTWMRGDGTLFRWNSETRELESDGFAGWHRDSVSTLDDVFAVVRLWCETLEWQGGS